MQEETYYLLALHQIEGIGDVYARKLVAQFGSAANVFKASLKDLKTVEGIETSRAKAIKNGFDENLLEKELKFIAKNDITVHSIFQDSYPQTLKEINDAPFILFSKGNANLNPQRPIAIIGSRNNTPQGKIFTETLVEQLNEYKACIVSGLAYGIDIIAHKAAIANDLSTIAVLAHGLDRIYPSAHQSTAKQMLEKGAWLSEYPSGTNPDRQNFPSRNRIVAGMTQASIVIETDIKGGAMITAKLALSYNRDVFALPGRYNDPRSAGCNYLIKTNIAQLITEANDIASFLNWIDESKSSNVFQQKLFENFGKDEMSIIQILQEKENVHVDELQIKTGFNSSQLASLLLQLEFQQTIKSLPGKRYGLM